MRFTSKSVMLSLSAILFSIPSREPFTKISFLAFIFQDLLLRQLDFRFPFLLHEKYPRFYGASYMFFVGVQPLLTQAPNKLFL
jgi:hypothetical protein